MIMQYTKLGNSDLTVSQICLGCMGFGDQTAGMHNWTMNEAASREIIAHALDLGINFFDTAIAYQNGSSERYVGKALRDMSQRDEVVIATKFLPRTAKQIANGITGQQAIN
jgi:1-deoxyxylulose-5-phosphate synthase